MEKETIFNSSLFSYNETTITGQNHSVYFPLPAWNIIHLTICSGGIIANSFVIYVVTFSSLRTSVFMNLVMILAIFDNLFLLSVINLETFGQTFIGPSVIQCSITFFLHYVCGVASSWVTVLISLERFIAIHFPFKVHIYCTKKRSCVTVVVLFIIVCSCLVPLLYISKVSLTDQGLSCTIIWNGHLRMIFLSLLFIFYSIVPAFCIVLLNILIIRKLKVQQQFRVRTHMQYSKHKTSNNTSQVVIMVFISCVFVATSFPSTILVLVLFSASVHGNSFPIWLFLFC